MNALNKKLKENETFALDAYNSVSDYIVTDCSTNTLSNMLNKYANYTLEEIISPEGENDDSNTYMEFYVDENELQKLIIDMFYVKK